MYSAKLIKPRKRMRTDLFDFELPAGSIALRPVSPRDSARMLIVQPDGVLLDRVVADLPHWLEPGDQLVVNDTKVIAAKLSGRRIGRDTEPKIEATLIKRLDGSRWQALAKPAKKLSEGDVVRFGNEGKVCLLGISMRRSSTRARMARLRCRFHFTGPCSIRRSAIWARPRCRLTSLQGARPMSAMPATTRPCSRSMRVRSRRRQRDCILPRRWRQRCANAVSKFTA